MGGIPEEILSVLIPDAGSVRAGEFAEIFSYLILVESHPELSLNGPKKWRWKDDRNKAALKTDIVLFNCVVGKPSPTDILIAGEAKAKATKSKTWEPIASAIDGSQIDYTGRLAKTLVWLREKAIKHVDHIERAKLERFIKSDEPANGPYVKKFKAIAVMDENFVAEELSKLVEAIPDPHEVLIVAIKNMKDFYQHVYSNIPKSFDKEKT